jgi:hypothetical protein
MKLMKAIAMSPVSIKDMPNPRKGLGMLEYVIFSRIAASVAIAKNQPKPDPTA